MSNFPEVSWSAEELQFKASSGQFNVDEAQGIVECFVAAVGNKDSVGDVVAPGAFDGSLRRRKPRVVWGHDWNQPIGKVLAIEEVGANDPRLPVKMKQAGVGGLLARVQFNLRSERGKEAFASVAFFGEDQEWSIGYKTIRANFDPQQQANVLEEVELFEVSPVLHGANQLTGTISVKSADEDRVDSFQKSKWPMFDRSYAANLKENHPDIWSKGGNIKGNDQYEILTKIAAQGGKATTEDQIKALELREAWIARHHADFRLPGIIAQIKWLAIGSRGEDHMKKVIKDAVAKKSTKGHGYAYGGDDYEQEGPVRKRVVMTRDGRGLMKIRAGQEEYEARESDDNGTYIDRNSGLGPALAATVRAPIQLQMVRENFAIFSMPDEYGDEDDYFVSYHFDKGNNRYMFSEPMEIEVEMTVRFEGENEEVPFGQKAIGQAIGPGQNPYDTVDHDGDGMIFDGTPNEQRAPQRRRGQGGQGQGRMRREVTQGGQRYGVDRQGRRTPIYEPGQGPARPAGPRGRNPGDIERARAVSQLQQRRREINRRGSMPGGERAAGREMQDIGRFLRAAEANDRAQGRPAGPRGPQGPASPRPGVERLRQIRAEANRRARMRGGDERAAGEQVREVGRFLRAAEANDRALAERMSGPRGPQGPGVQGMQANERLQRVRRRANERARMRGDQRRSGEQVRQVGRYLNAAQANDRRGKPMGPKGPQRNQPPPPSVDLSLPRDYTADGDPSYGRGKPTGGGSLSRRFKSAYDPSLSIEELQELEDIAYKGIDGNPFDNTPFDRPRSLARRIGGGRGGGGRGRRGITDRFDPNAEDGDGDGIVQDGTPWQRPAVISAAGKLKPSKLQSRRSGRSEYRAAASRLGPIGGESGNGRPSSRDIQKQISDSYRSLADARGRVLPELKKIVDDHPELDDNTKKLLTKITGQYSDGLVTTDEAFDRMMEVLQDANKPSVTRSIQAKLSSTYQNFARVDNELRPKLKKIVADNANNPNLDDKTQSKLNKVIAQYDNGLLTGREAVDRMLEVLDEDTGPRLRASRSGQGEYRSMASRSVPPSAPKKTDADLAGRAGERAREAAKETKKPSVIDMRQLRTELGDLDARIGAKKSEQKQKIIDAIREMDRPQLDKLEKFAKRRRQELTDEIDQLKSSDDPNWDDISDGERMRDLLDTALLAIPKQREAIDRGEERFATRKAKEGIADTGNYPDLPKISEVTDPDLIKRFTALQRVNERKRVLAEQLAQQVKEWDDANGANLTNIRDRKAQSIRKLLRIGNDYEKLRKKLEQRREEARRAGKYDPEIQKMERRLKALAADGRRERDAVETLNAKEKALEADRKAALAETNKELDRIKELQRASLTRLLRDDSWGEGVSQATLRKYEKTPLGALRAGIAQQLRASGRNSSDAEVDRIAGYAVDKLWKQFANEGPDGLLVNNKGEAINTSLSRQLQQLLNDPDVNTEKLAKSLGGKLYQLGQDEARNFFARDEGRSEGSLRAEAELKDYKDELENLQSIANAWEKNGAAGVAKYLKNDSKKLLMGGADRGVSVEERRNAEKRRDRYAYLFGTGTFNEENARTLRKRIEEVEFEIKKREFFAASMRLENAERALEKAKLTNFRAEQEGSNIRPTSDAKMEQLEKAVARAQKEINDRFDGVTISQIESDSVLMGEMERAIIEARDNGLPRDRNAWLVTVVEGRYGQVRNIRPKGSGRDDDAVDDEAEDAVDTARRATTEAERMRRGQSGMDLSEGPNGETTSDPEDVDARIENALAKMDQSPFDLALETLSEQERLIAEEVLKKISADDARANDDPEDIAWTLEETAKQLGVSKEKARDLIKQTELKLRDALAGLTQLEISEGVTDDAGKVLIPAGAIIVDRAEDGTVTFRESTRKNAGLRTVKLSGKTLWRFDEIMHKTAVDVLVKTMEMYRSMDYGFGEVFFKVSPTEVPLNPANAAPDLLPQERVTGDILRGYGPRRGNLERLLRYWRPIMRKPGGFRRCRVILADHPELYPLENLCAWLHHETTGLWPNEGCHHPGMKNCRRKIKKVVRGSLFSDAEFNDRLQRMASGKLNVRVPGGKMPTVPGKSADGQWDDDDMYAKGSDEMTMRGVPDLTDDDIAALSEKGLMNMGIYALKEFMVNEPEWVNYLRDESNWEHIGDDNYGYVVPHILKPSPYGADDGRGPRHHGGECGCGGSCGCKGDCGGSCGGNCASGLKSVIADLEYSLLTGVEEKAGRALNSRNAKRVRDAIQALQEILKEVDRESVEPSVASKGYGNFISADPRELFALKSLLDPVLDYHDIEAKVLNDGILIEGFEAMSIEAVDAIDNLLNNFDS